MSKRLQKVVSVTTSVTTILWLSGVAAFAPMAAFAATINEGDIIKSATNPDVYIAKYVGAKKFKRLILNPDVFNSYGHLKWSNLKTVTQAEMDAFTTSDLVKALGDTKVYKLVPNGDVGTKQWLNMTAEAFTAGGYDWDAIYVINNVDRDNYTVSSDITGGTSASPSVSASTAAGSLSVSLASDTPAAGVAVENAARFPFTKVNFTAGASDATITALTVQRTGLADDAALSSLSLVDVATNLQVGLNQTLNASHQVVFRDTLTIPANTTKSYYLSANMPASLDSYAGQIAALSLVGVTTSATLSGVLPISGNGQTLNATLTIGSFTGSAGSLNVATSSKAVGTTAFSFSGLKLTAGSAEDVTVYSIRFNQSGSAAASDLANIIVSDGTTNYATTVSSDGKYYTASFGTAGLLIAKGLNKEFTVKGDIVGGSARTIKFDIYRSTDIVVKGNTYGYYLTITTNTTDPFNTAVNPIFMGSTITVSSGTLRVDKSASGAPAANVTLGAQGVLLGAFDFVVQGESVNVTSLVLEIATTTTGNKGAITNLTLSKADGTIIAGPVNTVWSAVDTATATFTGTVSFPVGTTQVVVKGNLDNNWTANDTIAVSFNAPSTKITSITGAVTGNSITASPTSQVLANTMTVKGGSLTVTVQGTPVAQTVIRGVTGYTFANYLFDASASGEDVKVTTISLRDTMAGTSVDVSQLSNMVLYDGATALNTGGNVVSLTGVATANFTFTLDNALIIPKGTQKTVALKGNIAGNATVATSHAWGLGASATVTATGVSTTQSISGAVSATAQAGQAMTIASAGQYSVALDSSSPVAKLAAANTTGNTMTVLKFSATSEQINVTKIRLSLTSASSTANDLSQVYIYDGSTLLGQGTIGTGNASGSLATASSTFTLTTPLQVPANTDKIVTIKADIAPIYTSNTVAGAGHAIAVNYYGSTLATENVGTGVSSGQQIAGYSATSAQPLTYIYRSVPTVTRTDVSTTKLTNSTMDLFKFKVAADAKGDIDLYKFVFRIATSVASVGQLSLVDVTGGVETTLFATTSSVIYLPEAGTAWVDGTSDINMVLLAVPGTWGNASSTRTVPAGTYKEFVLRGVVTGATTAATVLTTLQGDSAYDLTNGTYMFDAVTVDGWTNDDFIWSDRSAASHSISTADWTNGFLVSGLPSSNTGSQTLSF